MGRWHAISARTTPIHFFFLVQLPPTTQNKKINLHSKGDEPKGGAPQLNSPPPFFLGLLHSFYWGGDRCVLREGGALGSSLGKVEGRKKGREEKREKKQTFGVCKHITSEIIVFFHLAFKTVVEKKQAKEAQSYFWAPFR